MNRTAILLTITMVLMGTRANLGNAETVLTGSTEGGAFFTISVPDELDSVQWNGDLVIWNHGIDLDPPEPNPDLGPFANLQLSEGYAVAASSYRQIGWAVFKTKNDLQNLVNVFKDEFGTPNQIFITGASLGGLVTAQAIEKANLGNVVGGYSLCGAQAGSRNWDGGLDLRLIYDVVCKEEEVPGASIPGGAEGLPEDSTLTEEDVFERVEACTGFSLDPADRTLAQSANLEQILKVFSGPGPNQPISEVFLDVLMRNATLTWGDIVHEKLSGKLGTGNANVDYGDPEINESIQRVSPNPGAKNRLARNYTPTGKVGDTKIVSIHTDKDGRVVVENESEYASVVPTENLTVAIVDEVVPTHCGFTDAEAVAGWESLRGWVAGGPQPTPTSIQGTCLFLDAVGLFDGPCRIDPTFVIPDMDDRFRPR